MSRPICRTAFLTIALLLSAPLAAQQAGATEDGNLGRQPRNAEVTTPQSAGTAESAPRSSGRSERPDAVRDAPYGTGFEARQRSFGGRGFGLGTGGGFGGGGRGGGGGGGRGR